MSNINNAIAVALSLVSVEGFDAAPARAVKAADRTKDQKLAVIADDIAKLAQKFDDVSNDRVTVRTAKAVYAPSIGDVVFATVGRNTATSKAQVKEGVVVAIKPAEIGEDGKAKGATQVRVQIGEGFDMQLVTLYPAQLVKKAAEGEEQEIAGAAE